MHCKDTMLRTLNNWHYSKSYPKLNDIENLHNIGKELSAVSLWCFNDTNHHRQLGAAIRSRLHFSGQRLLRTRARVSALYLRTCFPASFPPSPPQRVKARFSDKSAARGGAGEKRHLGAFRDGRHRQTDRPTASLQKPPTLRHTTHNPLWNRMLKCETYIYLFYFSFLAGTPAKNQEKNRAIVQQVFPCL